jgi:predicted ATPase/transcriptional regulator with XRE-family HTH domain
MAKGQRKEAAVVRGSFGARLRTMREMSGLTQEELAGRAGLSPNAVSALERGQRRRPYPHTVRALADALELPEEEHAALLAAVPKRNEPVPSGSQGAAPPASRLPRPVTPLVGRGREVEQVVALILRPGTRLLTLTGIGGVGKTRLAEEAARGVEESFPDGVAFVSLASLSDPALFVPTVLRSLGQGEAEGRSPFEALIEHLREKRLLLVLDNFEQLLEAAPEVATLVEECPSLTVLVTSRAPLRVRGEQEYSVPPLALPASTRSPDEAAVAGSSSGRLFLERARAVSPSFGITAENAAAVAAICWRLAGLPLALELAAAKVRLLDPAALLPRLDQALSTAWARDLPERQRTMRATLDWSYDLLDAPEQRLFRRLSAFVGGFSLEAAEAVSGDGTSGETLAHLGTLVEQSMVFVETGAGETRYGMLEPVRQYARAKLGESTGAADTLRSHNAHYLDLAEQASSELWGPQQGEWLERLERENGNLRAAIAWALQSEASEAAARLCWSLWLFWWVRGHHREGLGLAETVLERDLPYPLKARASLAAATMSYTLADYPAAREYWEGALRYSQQAGDTLAEAYSWAGTGLVEIVRPDYEEAARRMEKALGLFSKCEEDSVATLTRTWLGTTLLARGDLVEAERHFEEGLNSARRRQDPLCTYVALYNLAQLALARNDLARAASTLEEGISLSGWTRDRANLAHFLEALAAVSSLRHDPRRSAVLLGAAETSLREVGALVYNFYVTDPSLRERTLSEAREALGEDVFEEMRARGEAMTFDDAVGYAIEEVGST